jgi:hypothetical protein
VITTQTVEQSRSEYDDDGDEAASTQKSPVSVRDNGNMPSPSLLPNPSPRASVTSSENDDDAVRVPTPVPAKQFFYGKNRKKWSATEPVRKVRTPQHNIVLKLPGLKGLARNFGNTEKYMGPFVYQSNDRYCSAKHECEACNSTNTLQRSEQNTTEKH